MVLYYDSALGIFSLLVAADGLRPLGGILDLLKRDGTVFTLQVCAGACGVRPWGQGEPTWLDIGDQASGAQAPCRWVDGANCTRV